MRALTYKLRENGFQVACLRAEETLIGIGDCAFTTLGEYFDSCTGPESRKAVIIADRYVWDLHGSKLKNELDSMEVDQKVVLVARGECSKSLETLNWVLRELDFIGAKRRTTILAFGGGVVSDMAGFAAATYMRGIPYVNIPTTLIAQVDAAIGGKVAVDTINAKNALGAFYHPQAVVIWPGFLKTLPSAELASGMAEVIKLVTLASPALFEEVESMGAISSETVSRINKDHLSRWVQTKMDFLASDPFEVGSLDRALNFGHSLGHAIESATQYQHYRHGEAVAIGMAMACRIAVARRILEPAVAKRIMGCLRQNDLPTDFPIKLVDEVWRCLEVVRDIRNGELREVLPVDLGKFCFAKDISREEYLAARTGDLPAND